MPVKRFALIDDRHQREPEVDDANTAGKERAKAAPREKPDIRGGVPPCRPVRAMRERVGQPVDERQPRMHLDGKASVGRRQEYAPTDPERLGHEAMLALWPPTCSITAFEKTMSNPRPERKRACVSLHIGTSG